MKCKINKEKGFQPFSVEITIETMQDAKQLYSVVGRTSEDAFESLWKVLENIIKEENN